MQILKDVFVAIPSEPSIGLNADVYSLSKIWQEINGCIGQIMPNVARAYYYYDFILALCLSCLFIFIISLSLFVSLI